MAELDDFQRFALNIAGIAFEDFRRYQLRRKLARKARFPEGLHKFRLDLVPNGRNVGCGGNCPCFGKLVQQVLQTEVVVAVGMGDVNRCKIFAGFGYPIHQFPRMLLGKKRIHKDGVAPAINERHSTRYPKETLLAGRDALASRTAAFLGQQLPLRFGHVFPLSRNRLPTNQFAEDRISPRC